MSDLIEQLVTRLAAAEKDLADLRARVVGMTPASIAPTSGGLEAQVAAMQSSLASVFVSMPQVAAGDSREREYDGDIVVDPGVFRVKVTMDGGVGGSASEDCSYTYSVDDEYGYKIAEDMTPEAPRIPKTQYAAGDGWGWGCGEGDDFILLDAGEKEVAEVIT